MKQFIARRQQHTTHNNTTTQPTNQLIPTQPAFISIFLCTYRCFFSCYLLAAATTTTSSPSPPHSSIAPIPAGSVRNNSRYFKQLFAVAAAIVVNSRGAATRHAPPRQFSHCEFAFLLRTPPRAGDEKRNNDENNKHYLLR